MILNTIRSLLGRIGAWCVAPESRFAALSIATAVPVLVVERDAVLAQLDATFLAPGSIYSLLSLLTAMLTGAGVVLWQRRARSRRTGWRLLKRALFPRRLWSASTRADAGFFLLNTFATGALIGWALLSFAPVNQAVLQGLATVFGPAAAPRVGPGAAAVIETVAMFLAYEFAYWFDHRLSHEWPWLWEFHRVHHTAETLTPATVARVHPVDSLVFVNITVLVMGSTHGVLAYLLGIEGHGYTVSGTNLLQLAFIYLTGQLQHSHVWIAWRGIWGRLFASPAHHQIHHASDPAYFGKNLGSALMIWDWMFGTLHLPERKRMKLVFGVEPGQESPHTITGTLVTPFARCGEEIKGCWSRVRRRSHPVGASAD